MSRKFSKVMIICAMVVLFPLLIVGTAFASYYSISAIVEVDTYVNYSNVSADANAFAGVLYKNKNNQTFTVEESHMNTLSLKASANGYNFQGWFNGDQTQYAEVLASGNEVEFVSTASELNVDITEYENLLAVFNVKEYEVTYKYKAQPNDTQEVVETKHYFFGDELLPNLVYAGIGYDFSGWKVETEAQTYTTASFANEGAITLVGDWIEQTQIDVNYFAEDKTTLLKSTKIYQNQDYTLDTIEDVFAQASATKLNGYKYSWVDDNGKVVTEINRKSAINVFANKEEIVYNVKLKAEGATFAGSTTAEITAVDASGLVDWFSANKWLTKYSFHKFAGLKFNGQTYNVATAVTSIRNEIIAQNPNGTENAIEVEAIIAKNFATVSIEDGISFKAAGASSIYNKDVYTQADLGKFAYSLPAYDVDSSETIYELLNMKLNDGSILKLFTAEGKEVELASLRIAINGTTLPSISVSGNETLNDVIEMLLAKVQIADADVFEITSITANFNIVG